MMVTTSQQLRDFAAKAEASPAWTADLQSELQSLITEPALTFLGQTIPPVDRTKAMDNLYRCRPTGWIIAAQEIAAAMNKGTKGAVASLAWWEPSAPPGTIAGMTHECYPKGICATLAVSILAAIAQTWAFIMEAHGR